MKLILVRHGAPNYQTDSLIPEGHLHAEAAAKRLADEKINRIFSSTCGRAMQTAEYTAKEYGLSIERLPFMREISWKNITDGEIPYNGHPWRIADSYVKDGENLLDEKWRENPKFSGTSMPESYDFVVENLDKWLETLGFVREGDAYRCVKAEENRIYALFSHGGSSSVLLSHVLNLAFPYVLYSICPDFTAITVLEFPENEGELVLPKILLLNDARHIHSGDLFYGQ